MNTMLAFIVLLALFFSNAAQATDIQSFQLDGMSPITMNSGEEFRFEELSFPQFDPSMGDLTAVRFNIGYEAETFATFINPFATPIAVGAQIQVIVNIVAPGEPGRGAGFGFAQDRDEFGAVLGAGGTLPTPVFGDGSASVSNAPLARFIGNGDASVDVFISLFADAVNGPSGFDLENVTVSPTVSVDYLFEAAAAARVYTTNPLPKRAVIDSRSVATVLAYALPSLSLRRR